MTINVLFVYGAGDDTLFGGALRGMQQEVLAAFGNDVYSPRIIDFSEYATLLRLLRQWNDPTILVGHSCGCMSITRAAVELSMERIPYLMAIAPSVFCEVAPLPPNVWRATQVSSNPADVFNPGARMLLSRSPINNNTQLDQMRANLPHIQAPASREARDRLVAEVRTALSPAMV